MAITAPKAVLRRCHYPSSNPLAVHLERNESFALKFRRALKIECFALLEMTELGIYQALSMRRKTLQLNRRLMTKRWGLVHRNLGSGCGALDAKCPNHRGQRGALPYLIKTVK